jgi:hypothetical protein
VSSWEREEDNWIIKIFVKIQVADLWRFDKHKKRATSGMGEYPPVMNCNCTLFAVHKALQHEWVIIPYHLNLICCTQKELQNSWTGSSLI